MIVRRDSWHYKLVKAWNTHQYATGEGQIWYYNEKPTACSYVWKLVATLLFVAVFCPFVLAWVFSKWVKENWCPEIQFVGDKDNSVV